MEYYRRSVTDTLEEVQSQTKGLTSAEVDNRLTKDGYNELKVNRKTRSGSCFWRISKIRWLLCCS